MSVFGRACELYNRENRAGDGFDRVYCVFDKDSHGGYAEALEAIAEFEPKGVFYSANSVPCFEYWVLLHFSYTTAPFTNSGGRSVAENVLFKLKDYMPQYEKGFSNLFVELIGGLGYAKANAARVLAEAKRNNTDNPSTYVHELVDYLQNLKSKENE